MEEFKQKVQKRMVYLKSFIVCVALIGAYDYFMIRNTGEKSAAQIVAIGFQIIILVGIGILACVYLMKLRNALWDEEKMRLLYARENDENTKVFLQKSGMPMMLVTSMGMILVGAIMAHFSITIFYTLILAAAAQLAAIVRVYFYYKRRNKRRR